MFEPIDRQQIAVAWLARFSAAVRNRDYAAARRLFSREVSAFGTVATMARGLDELESRQWRMVWERTSGYQFQPESVVAGGAADCLWIAARWTSTGLNPDQSTCLRSGRATFVLLRAEGDWLAVHSHHSRDPSGTV